MQLLPEISSVSPLTTVFPLVIVLSVSAVKDAIDDFVSIHRDLYAGLYSFGSLYLFTFCGEFYGSYADSHLVSEENSSQKHRFRGSPMKSCGFRRDLFLGLQEVVFSV